MGLIVRTAGLSRTKVEIKRDFDYLARLWDEIRERTLGSTAPALIYRDSDLIKRAIRDLYHREIDEVIVEGEEGYKAARGFMKLLMPSHVRRVKLHSETTPLFQRYGVEDQLSAMYQPIVQLKSGGYLVINPTEALVSIDINSGRSTREHNIEQTAYNTNLEAAQEIARQLRLRDMAGLIVIDFIDMEQSSHVRKVEKAMKEALKNDRARIQVGRISSFGLMEMSRQRLRTGVLEASTKPCPHCEGTGLMRTAASAGLSALRILEDEAARGRGERICLRAGREAAVYVLNKKRAELADIEQRYGVMIEVLIDESFEGARMTVESSGPRPVAVPRASRRRSSTTKRTRIEELDEDDEAEDEEEERRRARGRARPSGRRRAPGPPPPPPPPRRTRARTPRGRRGTPRPARPSRSKRCRAKPRRRASRGDRRSRRRGAARRRTPSPPAPWPRRRGCRSASRGRRSSRTARRWSSGRSTKSRRSPRRSRPKSRSRSAKRGRRKKAAAEAEVAVAEPAPAEAPPAETADAGRAGREAGAQAPVEEGRSARAEPEAAPAPSRSPVPAANNDTAEEIGGEPRRGWWQRTFG